MTRFIHVNGRFLSQGITGTQRYAFEILKSMVSGSPREIILHVPRNCEVPTELSGTKIVRSRLKGVFFDQFHMAIHSRGGTLLSLSGPITLFKSRQLGVIHDVGFLKFRENYNQLFVIWYWIMYRVATSRVKKIATVSNFSRLEIQHAFPRLKSQIILAPGSGNHVRGWESTRPSAVPAQLDFLLMVGTVSRRKNVMPTLAYLLEADFNVVVCGSSGPKAVFSRPQFIEDLEKLGSGKAIFVQATDSELSWLFQNCRAFVFPSLYEGFGIPPLEALNCGARVIASSASAMPEVLGDRADYFNPTNFDGLLVALKKKTNFRSNSANPGWTEQSWEMSANFLLRHLQEMESQES